MRNHWLAVAAAIVGSVVTVASAGEPINLKVLYAGNTGSDREKDFVSFLEEQFAKVTTIGLGSFKDADAQGHDVVIFDWTSIYPRDKDGKIDNNAGNISGPPNPQVSQSFDRPAILIGAVAGNVAHPLQLKINWL